MLSLSLNTLFSSSPSHNHQHIRHTLATDRHPIAGTMSSTNKNSSSSKASASGAAAASSRANLEPCDFCGDLLHFSWDECPGNPKRKPGDRGRPLMPPRKRPRTDSGSQTISGGASSSSASRGSAGGGASGSK